MSYNQIEYIPVSDLAFDPENPRLPESLREKKGDAEYEALVINWMLQYENVTELMGSIGEKGFFAAEPILVVESNEGKFEVIEGNRRLTAVKILNNPAIATKKKKTIEEILEEVNEEMIPAEIPSIRFSHREEVLAYLGYKHITGVQAWDSLAKAKYLRQLLKTLPKAHFYEQCKTLAKIIGSKTNYVRLLLVGVDVYSMVEDNNFYDIPNLEEANFEFGVFYTALNRGNISKYVGIDFDSDDPAGNVNNNRLQDLTRWIFEKNSEGNTRLGESRNLAKLNKILDDSYPKAIEAFRDGKKTLDEATRLTNHPQQVFQKSLNDSLSSLEIARNYSHEINEPTETQLDTLKEIFQMARDLYRLTKAKLIDIEDDLD